MKFYHPYCEKGVLVIDGKLRERLLEKFNCEAWEIPYKMDDSVDIFVVNNATGILSPTILLESDDESLWQMGDMLVEDDEILFLIPRNICDMFSTAYESPEALREEYRERVRELGVDVPEDWRVEDHIMDMEVVCDYS